MFAEGEEANTNSDVFTVAALLFAVVLSFAAISERFSYLSMRTLLLGLAVAGLLSGPAIVLSQPVTSG